MSDFDYGLPEDSIAQVPVEPRSAARLLDATDPSGALRHRRVAELPELLREGDVVVVNDSKVIAARLELFKATGGRVELLLVDRTDPSSGEWEAMVRPLKRCPPGTELVDASHKVVAKMGPRTLDGSRASVVFRDPTYPDRAGEVALPPYIRVPLEDPTRYQTVYARTPGSVAAPTAGLHLTTELIEACRRAGASFATVELAVGLDTFKPVTAHRAEDHVMHSESYRVPQESLEACHRARRQGGRVVAVGTTVVRALESAARGACGGRTDLFIRGDFEFRLVDLLMTNFHMPRSTLLLMVESFCGSRWRDIYAEALAEGYRFLSFGDAMIVNRP